ncbi:hypothetical protein ACPA54_16640 [Uniformispora flossi]|uniref:hypothetical protein n=1 Tax=Uniformispora flossi TaxID=3390723 RepID=UPI003C2AD4E4
MDDKIASAGYGEDGARAGEGAATRDLDAADARTVEEVIAKAVGKRLTRPLRDELRRLGAVVRARGETCDVVRAATDRPWTTPSGALYDLDLDLLDAALEAGVPVADPGAGTAFASRTWLARARRGQLAAVAADARFRPLLRDAVLDWRGDLLALGRPGALLSHEEGAAEAVLGAAGIVDVLGEAVAAWAEQVRGGSLPALHEAVHYLDLLGPARLADASADPGLRDAIGTILAADPAEALAATWRTGLVDELGDAGLDAYGRFGHTDDVFRIAPDDGAAEDTFVVADENRSIVFGPRGVVAGPLYSRFRHQPNSAETTDLFRYADGTYTAEPLAPGDTPDTAVTLPGAPAPVRAHRTAAGYWELHDAYGTATGRWYQGPARPNGVSGTHSVGRQRHRWASGSELVPPPQVWHRLPARDTAGSRLLRTADRALAARVLDAASGPDGDIARHVTELGRRHPVGDHSWEVAEAFTALRAAAAPELPGITADRLLDGIAGTLWTALETRVLAARHLDDANALRTTPLPRPRADAGDLRARIFTGMQDMYRRIQTVADLCADPDVLVPPHHIDLANAQGWEQKLGRLGGQALRAALSTASTARGNDLNHDGLRSCGALPMSDPAGRWRTMTLTLDVRNAPREGTVCRTPRGCLIVLQRSNSGPVTVLEYAADGVFDAPPFGSTTDARICAGWGGADRIAALLRLLDERGAAPWPEKSVAAFAEATHMSVARAAILTVGFEPRSASMVRRGNPGMTQPFADAAGLSAGDLADAGAGLARDVPVELRLELPEYLMPDDPEDLWRDRLAVTRAAAWWNAAVLDGPTTPG